MMNFKCFVTVEDVLMGFSGGIINLVREGQLRGEEKMPTQGPSDIGSAEFLAKLEYLPDGPEILSLAEQYFGRDNVWLRARPWLPETPQAGMPDWIRRHIPFYEGRLVTWSAPKCDVASNHILVDTLQNYCAQFFYAGGFPVLMHPVTVSNTKHPDNLTWLERQFQGVYRRAGISVPVKVKSKTSRQVAVVAPR